MYHYQIANKTFYIFCVKNERTKIAAKFKIKYDLAIHFLKLTNGNSSQGKCII